MSGEVEFQSHLQTSRKRKLGQKGDEINLSFFFWVSIPLLVLSAIIDYTDHFFYSKR